MSAFLLCFSQFNTDRCILSLVSLKINAVSSWRTLQPVITDMYVKLRVCLFPPQKYISAKLTQRIQFPLILQIRSAFLSHWAIRHAQHKAATQIKTRTHHNLRRSRSLFAVGFFPFWVALIGPPLQISKRDPPVAPARWGWLGRTAKWNESASAELRASTAWLFGKRWRRQIYWVADAA